MASGVAWTIVGSAAAVVAVVVGVLQLRQGRMHARAAPSADAPGDKAAGVVLPPPVGRLPARVWGRDGLVGTLTGLATAPDGRVHVLAGLGGCGKSTVALAVAQQARDAGGPVWWLPAVDRASVTAGLLGLALLLGAADGEVQEALAGRINPSDVLWQRLEATRGWVLVLDNSDDAGALAVGDRAVGEGAGWLRPTRAGLVLVTSRTGEVGVWGPLATVHQVGPLDEEDGGRVLADLAPGAGDAADARVLARRLGGLPLALHQAGSYLGSPFAVEQTFTGYGQALAERFGELLGRGDDDRARLIGTWELSLDALAAQGREQARALLRVVSCFAAAVPVPAVLLDVAMLGRCCGGRARTEDGLSGLLAVGLIETRSPEQEVGRPLLVVHPLVAETIRHQAGDALADSFALAVDLLDAAAGRLNVQDLRDRAGWLALLPHLRALLDLDVAAPATVLNTLARSAVNMSAALRRGGLYLASLEVAESALRRGARMGGEREQIALRFQRACAREWLGHAAQAEAEYWQVLDAQLRILGPDHPDTLATRYGIAYVIADQGKPAEAEAEYRQVLDARLRVLGPDHPDTLNTRHNIAWLLADQGKPAEAEAEFRQVLDAQLQALGPDDRDTLHIRHHIARVLAVQGKAAEAEAEFRDVLDVQLRVLGPDHPDTLVTQYGIASALAVQGKAAEAEGLYREVLDVQLRILGPDHPDTLRTSESVQRLQREDG